MRSSIYAAKSVQQPKSATAVLRLPAATSSLSSQGIPTRCLSLSEPSLPRSPGKNKKRQALGY